MEYLDPAETGRRAVNPPADLRSARPGVIAVAPDRNPSCLLIGMTAAPCPGAGECFIPIDLARCLLYR